jgi:hypothetical protein
MGHRHRPAHVPPIPPLAGRLAEIHAERRAAASFIPAPWLTRPRSTYGALFLASLGAEILAKV